MDFYGDNDPFACAWLRELIRQGHLPQGTVDERSIHDLSATDLQGYRQVHLFAGIGGWAHTLQLAGWPANRPVWTGSCPCQPFSAAGKRQGQADERHLWPVFFRLIRECQPATVFGEQVASDDGYRWLARVRDDLEEAGYAVGCADLPACSAGAPHIRQRLFWVANATHTRHVQRDLGDKAKAQRSPSGRKAKRYEGRRRNDAADGGDARRLDNPASQRCERDGAGRLEIASESPRQGVVAGGTGEFGRLANPDGGNASNRDLQRGGEHGQQPEDGGTAGGVADLQGDGRRQGSANLQGSGEGTGAQGAGGGPANDSGGFWGRYDLIPCRDGKVRRIPRRFESGIQPVADGIPIDLGGMWAEGVGIHPLAQAKIPGRAGLLRGAGNAIVAQVAAVFIRAFLEAEHDR